jgi:hypothetical protein
MSGLGWGGAVALAEIGGSDVAADRDDGDPNMSPDL